MRVANQSVWLATMLVMLVGCGIFSRPPDISGVRDGVAVTYASVSAGAEVTKSLLAQGVISTEDARFSQSLLERTFALTQIAEREALAGDPDSAQEILQTASRILLDLQHFLGRRF